MHSPSASDSAPRTWLHRFETWLIVAVSLTMVILPIASTLARIFTGNSLTGAIIFVQHLTLWAGFVGALIATGARAHLALATTEFLPPGRPQNTARFLANTVAGIVTAGLAYAAVVMIQADSQNDVKLFQLIPEWWSELVMPFALTLMALRCGWQASDDRRWRAASLALITIILALLLQAIVRPAEAPTWFETQVVAHVWLWVALVLLAVLFGAPIYVGMAGLAMLFFVGEETPVATVPIEIFRLVASPTLPAIPLLTLCGFVLAEGGASTRLVRAARALVGFMPGGVAIMVTIVCALFTTLTGGSGVTIIALGGLMLPILVKEGYPEGFSLGLVTAAGSLGLLFPPSLPVILYSVVAETSADRLFLAGLLPGTLMVLMVAGYGIFTGARAELKRQPFDLKEARQALWQAKWEFAIPLLLFYGIFGGKTTIVEAAAIAAAMAVTVEVFVFKDLKLKTDLPRVIAGSGRLMGAVVIVLGAAMGLTSYLVDAQIPTRLLTWVTQNVHSPALFLLALNVILLILGSVLEIFSAIVILAPLIVPMASAFNIDKVHMGIIFLANLELGFLFPPVGLNLLLSSSRFHQPLPRIYKVSTPFLVMMAIAVLLITYLPWLSVGFMNAVSPANP